MFLVIKAINIAAMAIGVFNVILVTTGKSFRGRRMLLLSAASLLVHTVGVYIEITAPSLDAALAGIQIQYLVAGNAALFLMMFLFEYCDVPCPKSLWAPMMGINLLAFALAMTCRDHRLFYTSIRYVEEGLYPHIQTGKGIFYGVFMLNLALIAGISVFLAIGHCRKPEGGMKREIVCLAAAVSVPCAVKLIHASGFVGVYDPTVAASMFSSFLLIFSVYRYNLTGIERQGKEQLLDDMREGFVLLDRDFCFLSANKQAKALFPELSRAKLGDRISQLAETSTLKIVTKVSTEKEIKGRFYEFRVTLLGSDSEKRGYIICAFDVTGAHDSYIKMSELKEKAESASRAKEEFLANISHEIRTPMNAIVGMSSLLMETDGLPERAREFAESIRSSSDVLLGLINDVLDFSRIDLGRIKIMEGAYQPRELFRDVEAITREKAEQKGLYLTVEISPRLPKWLTGDKVRVKQLVLNLVSNGIKFTKSGGVTVQADWDDGQLTVRVIDTGIGIKEENMVRLFKEFSRIEEQDSYVEGTGLGLSICRQILDLMGGEIYAESVYGKGSTFTFRLPQKESENSGYDTTAGSIPAFEDREKLKSDRTLSGMKILVTDDNRINLRVTQQLLQALGAIPYLATSGYEAIEYISKGDNLPQLILMDYMMPGIDGIETARRIRALNAYGKNVPIVALTADAVKGEEEKFLKNGFNGYLSKPIDLHKLGEYLLAFVPTDKDETALSQLEGRLGGMADVRQGAQVCGGINGYLKTLETFGRKEVEILTELQFYVVHENFPLYRKQASVLKDMGEKLGCKRLYNMSKAMETAEDQFIVTNHEVYLDYLKTLFRRIKESG